MASCLGPFCGRFPDIHKDSDDSDDEVEDDDTRGLKTKSTEMVGKPNQSQWFWSDRLRKMRKRRQQRQREKELSSGSHGGAGAGRLKWGQYESQITVQVKRKGAQEEKQTQTVTQIKAVGAVLTPDMMRSIPRNRVHTLILNKCHRDEIPSNLHELEDLRVIQMSNNRLAKFAEEIKVEKLERIIFDHNEIRTILPGVFTSGENKATFPKLEVLNLSFNKLSSLPKDFKLPALQHLDISHNLLDSLPEGILQSKELQTMDVSHNKLVRLPEGSQGFVFPRLQKLFVSFNLLEQLPKDIGECKDLEKIRMVENRVRELPESILKLWQKNAGHLEEMLVERNPLVKPSITAFQMERALDGLNRAFELFKEELEQQKAREAAEADKVKAIGPAPMDGDGSVALARIPEEGERKGGRPEADKAGSQADSNGDGQKFRQNQGSAMDYYFAFYGNEQEIMQVRNAESALLLRKKNLYVEKKLEARRAKGDMQKGRNAKRSQEAGEEEYEDMVVRVTDTDVYFSLLVMTSKPMFSLCQTLFDKFETTNNQSKGEKTNTWMNKPDWVELCTSVLVNMPEEHVQRIWELLAWKQEDRIFLNDFVAGWHIHDLSVKDIWLKRICKVLNLAFYDMEPDDLEDRLRARGAQDATPQLDFEKDSDDELEEILDSDGMLKTDGADPNDASQDTRPAGHVYPLPKIDGERRVVVPSRTGGGVAEPARSRRSSAASSAGAAAAVEETLATSYRVSMSDQQYSQYVNTTRDDGDAAADADDNVSSSVLSESDSQDSDFDAQIAVAKSEAMLVGSKPDQFKVDSDSKLRQLMEMPIGEFYRTNEMPTQAKVNGLEPTVAKKKRRKKRRKRIKDRNFNTDVFSVRQAVREAYRNMPFDDFVKLVNFLLRGMQAIKHPGRNLQTYWHADDPTFKFTMGQNGRNVYTRQLLEQMGFVMLNDIYWVWPAKHFNLASEKEGGNERSETKGPRTWGFEKIPPKCPGLERDRLDDMINLLRRTQKSIHKEGRDKFRGHFRGD